MAVYKEHFEQMMVITTVIEKQMKQLLEGLTAQLGKMKAKQ